VDKLKKIFYNIIDNKKERTEKMKMIACKCAAGCYFLKDGHCRKPVLSIDENGMCSEKWRKGRPREPVMEPPHKHLDSIAIVDAEFEEVKENNDD
jgi:hypothetical protein